MVATGQAKNLNAVFGFFFISSHFKTICIQDILHSIYIP